MFAGRRLSTESIVLVAVGAVFFSIGAFICVSAYKAAQTRPVPGPAVVARLAPAPALPPPLPMGNEPEAALPAPYAYTPAAPPKSIFSMPVENDAPPAPKYAPAPKSAPAPASAP